MRVCETGRQWPADGRLTYCISEAGSTSESCQLVNIEKPCTDTGEGGRGRLLRRSWAQIDTEKEKKTSPAQEPNDGEINVKVPRHIFYFYFHEPSFQPCFVVWPPFIGSHCRLRESRACGKAYQCARRAGGSLGFGLLPAAQWARRESRNERRGVSSRT